MTVLPAAFLSIWSTLQRQPIVTNSLTGAALCAISDGLAQKYKNPAELDTPAEDLLDCSSGNGLDIRRLCAAGILGAAFGGFVYPFCYSKLDSMFRGAAFSVVLKKSIVEICTVGVFVNSVSMATRGLVQGRPARDVSSHVASELPRVMMNDCRVWLPYNLISFSFIPIALRPVSTMCMEAAWQTYISLRSHDYSPT